VRRSQPAAGGGGGGDTARNLTIQMVTHEQAGDTFWDKIRAGAEDAAKAHGITLQYSNNRTARSRPRWCRTRSTARCPDSP
jgi:simple sugar transport system substrate-binding protein